jgi:hypothetical protein
MFLANRLTIFVNVRLSYYTIVLNRQKHRFDLWHPVFCAIATWYKVRLQQIIFILFDTQQKLYRKCLLMKACRNKYK